MRIVGVGMGDPDSVPARAVAEVRDAALDSLVGSVREAGSEVSAIAHAIRHPLDSAAVASLATPLVSVLLKAAKREKGVSKPEEPQPSESD